MRAFKCRIAHAIDLCYKEVIVKKTYFWIVPVITNQNSIQVQIDTDYVLNMTIDPTKNFGLFPEDLSDIYSTDRIFEQMNFRPTPLNRPILIHLTHSGAERTAGCVK